MKGLQVSTIDEKTKKATWRRKLDGYKTAKCIKWKNDLQKKQTEDIP